MRNIRVVAGALVVGRRVLVAQRGEEQAHARLWEFPGGKVEPGETDEVALQRELWEELGVRVRVGERLGVSRVRDDVAAIEMFLYRCEVEEGTPRLLEHLELRWLEGAALSELAWAPADVPLVSVMEEHLGRDPLSG